MRRDPHARARSARRAAARDLRRRRRADRAPPARRALGRRRVLREERPHDGRARPCARRRSCSPASRRASTIHEIPPAEIKKAVVGTGAATKEQVQFMLTRLLRLKSVPQPSDAADGVAAALALPDGRSRRRRIARCRARASARMIAQSQRARCVAQGARSRRDHDAGGVGYELPIPLGVYETLPRAGEPVALHTHLVVKEDGWQLFGFSTHVRAARLPARARTRKAWARRSRSACCRRSRAERLVRAIRDKDIATLQSVPRVGRKKAEQLILDLADKLDDLQVSGVGGRPRPEGAGAEDAIRALVVARLFDAPTPSGRCGGARRRRQRAWARRS